MIDLINSLEECFHMPECFELSMEKLKTREALMMIIHRVMHNDLRAGEQIAILEIMKSWIEKECPEIAHLSDDAETEERKCDECIHHKTGTCSSWECDFERRDES